MALVCFTLSSVETARPGDGAALGRAAGASVPWGFHGTHSTQPKLCLEKARGQPKRLGKCVHPCALASVAVAWPRPRPEHLSLALSCGRAGLSLCNATVCSSLLHSLAEQP